MLFKFHSNPFKPIQIPFSNSPIQISFKFHSFFMQNPFKSIHIHSTPFKSHSPILTFSHTPIQIPFKFLLHSTQIHSNPFKSIQIQFSHSLLLPFPYSPILAFSQANSIQIPFKFHQFSHLNPFNPVQIHSHSLFPFSHSPILPFSYSPIQIPLQCHFNSIQFPLTSI